jgi:pyruvate kinase
LPNAVVRRTKIVATLGPAWESEEGMHSLLDAGVDVVRINSSHGTPEIRESWIRRLHRVLESRSDGHSCAVLVDLRGPRIRVGALGEPITLTAGSTVTFAPVATCAADEIPTTYDQLARDVFPGASILLDDGLLAVDVTEVRGQRVTGRVRHGGVLKANKGINLPGVDVSAPAVSERDAEEVERAVAAGADFIAMSFVRRKEDVEALRRLVPRSVRIISKIEKDTALKHLQGILQASDAIMVARGDLGVELPFEEVPLVQKRLIKEANIHGKPVITATQMLESMIQAPRPTRAEASDVANAILDGTDAVMLSAETAVGQHPRASVEAMVRIAHEIETQRRVRSPAFDLAVGRRVEEGERWLAGGVEHRPARTEAAIAVAVNAAAEVLGAPLIVCFTSSGFTARTVASYRPSVPILAVTPEAETFRQLSLVWGVVPMQVDHFPSYDAMIAVARQKLLALNLASPGDRVVVTAGVPFDTPGTTNLLKIEAV